MAPQESRIGDTPVLDGHEKSVEAQVDFLVGGRGRRLALTGLANLHDLITISSAAAGLWFIIDAVFFQNHQSADQAGKLLAISALSARI